MKLIKYLKFAAMLVVIFVGAIYGELSRKVMPFIRNSSLCAYFLGAHERGANLTGRAKGTRHDV